MRPVASVLVQCTRITQQLCLYLHAELFQFKHTSVLGISTGLPHLFGLVNASYRRANKTLLGSLHQGNTNAAVLFSAVPNILYIAKKFGFN